MAALPCLLVVLAAGAMDPPPCAAPLGFPAADGALDDDAPPPPPPAISLGCAGPPAQTDNRYVVEGVNTAGLTYGSASSGVMHDSAGLADVVPERAGLDVFLELASLHSRDERPDLRQLDFTDLTLVTVGGRWSSRRRLELFAQSTFVAKQPASTDEALWQHAELTARGQVLGPVALSLGGGAGRLRDGAGWTWSAGGGLQARHSFERLIQLEGALDASTTRLELDGGAPWLVEVSARAELQVRVCPRCTSAAWLGVGFRVPVADGGDAGPALGALEPDVAMEANLGVITPLGPRWLVYATVHFRDRGEPADPRSEWPVLDGGFDQTLFGVGLVRRFDFDDGFGERGGGHDDGEAYVDGCMRRGDCGGLIRR